VGKVGTGFSRLALRTLSDVVNRLKTEVAPFEVDVPEEITWLKPVMVCEVRYQTVTKDGRLRMPRFRSLRSDKLPSECTVDQLAQGELGEYLSKRDFTVTKEPVGGGKTGESKIFVVQEHHARRLHYDLRLESDGVLKSWAVPKGMPENPDQKRLAVETEDHPLEYANFEGTIPKGQYGAGAVKIWDEGVYEVKVWDEKMVEFTLKGQKLTGRYVLVRLKKAGEKSWLLLKGREKNV
jgi:DNA ligase D-like protein (predicted 3'-phosphoesterase)